MKPVELAARAIFNSSRKGDSVADPYLGSGTTLVAADELGRRGIGIEIEPRFFAVALQRMADRGAKIVKTFSPSDAMLAREFLFGAPAAAPGGRP
jgi:DNA modification methylase